MSRAVPTSGSGSNIIPPTQIMRNRNARENARREEERQEAERKRVSAERRAATLAGAVPRTSQASSHYSPDVSNPQPAYHSEHRRSRTVGEVAGTNVLGDPTGRTQQDYPPTGSRTRGSSQSQQDQPRAPQASASAQRRPQASQSAPRQPSQAAPGAAAASASARASASADPGDGSQQRNTSSSFPHAFERWETLSSHWEGLTSYWLHKLELNQEEIRENVPNASVLHRQITDLSAAGANLFHAVVELQRLRASSERKFQRWFYDTRGELERLKETLASTERQLEAERKQRDSRLADNSISVENAKREVAEMKRELNISKDEARRAWEELGRRNQDALDTAQSLREGKVTVVSGVQVVPYFASRTGSAAASHPRPGTQDGRSAYGGTGAGSSVSAAGLQSPTDERNYYRDVSPSNTDPFTEAGRQQGLHHEPGHSSLTQESYPSYGMHGTPASQATATTAIPTGAYSQSQSPSQYATGRADRTPTAAVSSPEAQRFYQHGGAGTFLHSPQTSTQNLPPQTATSAPDRHAAHSPPGSYTETLSEGVPGDDGVEYALDAHGRVQYDAHGHPIPFVRRREPVRSSESGEDSDAYHAERAQYASTMIPEAPQAPSTSAAAMAGFQPTAADYSGDGYDGWEGYGVGRGQAHHHPTRLSDVLEEEEERSSRRTGD